MDGTAGAQVVKLEVSGDDLIFKSQGGTNLMTLKHEGQTEIHGNITASGNISASGTIEADSFNSDGKNAIGNTGAAIVVGNQADFPVKIGRGGTTNIELRGPVTASGNISASGNITGVTGSFEGGLVLTSPNGTKYRFTTNDSGHLSLTGSAV